MSDEWDNYTSYKNGIKLEIGYLSVIIDKIFGPQIFASLKITPDTKTNSWVIERQRCDNAEWIEWIRIPGQLDFEFNRTEDEEENNER